MRVVKALEDEKNAKEKVEDTNIEQGQVSENKSGYIRLKKFHFIMLLFLVVFLSAGITTFALAFGDEKVVTVGTERQEFTKLYEAFDTLKSGYYKKIDQK